VISILSKHVTQSLCRKFSYKDGFIKEKYLHYLVHLLGSMI
jgi:hypothetical protein